MSVVELALLLEGQSVFRPLVVLVHLGGGDAALLIERAQLLVEGQRALGVLTRDRLRRPLGAVGTGRVGVYVLVVAVVYCAEAAVAVVRYLASLGGWLL